MPATTTAVWATSKPCSKQNILNFRRGDQLVVTAIFIYARTGVGPADVMPNPIPIS